MTKEKQLGTGPIERRFSQIMPRVADMIVRLLKKQGLRAGFVFIMVPFHPEPGRCNYISNCNRADIINLLKEQLAVLQGMPEAKPQERSKAKLQ